MRNRPRTIEELQSQSEKVFELLNEMPDQVVAVVAATYLEEALGVLLRTAFVEDEKVVNQLIPAESSGHGLDFYRRIAIAYAIGLITKETYHDLDAIRRIRNIFAHNYTGCTFDAEDISSLCNGLSSYSGLLRFMDRAMHLVTTPRSMFVMAFVGLNFDLQMRALRRRHAVAGEEFRIPLD